MPGINPKQMQAMMKKMGIAQTPIHATKVIFKTSEGDLVINDPDVLKVMMQGQESYQVSGHAEYEDSNEEETEEEIEKYTEEDVEMVMTQTEKDEETVKQILEETNGDIAEAIMKLKE